MGPIEKDAKYFKLNHICEYINFLMKKCGTGLIEKEIKMQMQYWKKYNSSMLLVNTKNMSVANVLMQ